MQWWGPKEHLVCHTASSRNSLFIFPVFLTGENGHGLHAVGHSQCLHLPTSPQAVARGMGEKGRKRKTKPKESHSASCSPFSCPAIAGLWLGSTPGACLIHFLCFQTLIQEEGWPVPSRSCSLAAMLLCYLLPWAPVP